MKQVSGRNYFHFYFFFFFLCCAAAFTSCKKQDNHHTQTFSLKADFQTESTVLQTGPPELDSIAGLGTGSPIGKSSFIAHARFDNNYNLTGIIETRTANGDSFFSSITGHAPDINDAGDITLQFNAVIVGGTGRYVTATGSFVGTAHESIYNSAGSAHWEGSITY